jgi:N utilization substance protein A
MKGSDLLRVVDQMQHEKHIKREVIFDSIEAALTMAAQKYYGEDAEISVQIDRDSGQVNARKGEDVIDPSVFDPAEFGRILASMAKQVMIQKIREAESNEVFTVYHERRGELVHGTIQRHEGGAAIIALGKSEAILPRGEQIPGETHHIGDRIKAVILDVKRSGQRVKIILSRTHADFVRRMFEQEIPEIQERIIEIRAIAREAGYRTKIAVSSIDLKVDCVGACVGVRGSRIKNVVDELGGERIDIVRWNDSLQVLIPNALQPAQIEDVFLYPRLGRAIVLVKEDQLSLAIGRRGQNVRLASKLVGWDIEIMTHDELGDSIEKAQTYFLEIPGVGEELVEVFIEEGFLSYRDITFMDPPELAELSGLTEEQADDIISFCEEAADRVDEEMEQARIAEAEARAAGLIPEKPAPLTPAQKAAEILPAGDDTPAQQEEQRYTVETVFGPDTGEVVEAPEAAPEEQGAGEAPAGEQAEEAPAGEQPAAEAEQPVPDVTAETLPAEPAEGERPAEGEENRPS